jgi:hypothetical protein
MYNLALKNEKGKHECDNDCKKNKSLHKKNEYYNENKVDF